MGRILKPWYEWRTSDGKIYCPNCFRANRWKAINRQQFLCGGKIEAEIVDGTLLIAYEYIHECGFKMAFMVEQEMDVFVRSVDEAIELSKK